MVNSAILSMDSYSAIEQRETETGRGDEDEDEGEDEVRGNSRVRRVQLILGFIETKKGAPRIIS